MTARIRMAVFLLVVSVGAGALAAQGPLVVRGQGGRPFGGTVLGDPVAGSIHCDHGYVEWQIPQNPRRLPLLMVHASSTKTRDTTFDGREGFRHIFLRRGFSVYLTDLPRTGRAGQGCSQTSYTPRPVSVDTFRPATSRRVVSPSWTRCAIGVGST